MLIATSTSLLEHDRQERCAGGGSTVGAGVTSLLLRGTFRGGGVLKGTDRKRCETLNI